MLDLFAHERTRIGTGSSAAFLRQILCGSPTHENCPPAATADAAPTLLTARDGAKALAICEKTLWAMTARGEMPVVRIGRSVRYDPRDLSQWVQKNKSARAE